MCIYMCVYSYTYTYVYTYIYTYIHRTKCFGFRKPPKASGDLQRSLGNDSSTSPAHFLDLVFCLGCRSRSGKSLGTTAGPKRPGSSSKEKRALRLPCAGHLSTSERRTEDEPSLGVFGVSWAFLLGASLTFFALPGPWKSHAVRPKSYAAIPKSHAAIPKG